ncbi:MAG: peroxiredoxin [Alphaproteobacteria bacterium RIFCSPHIGHO2_12_FULL_63_12]|nr:MAG: peroxiredoxin [Alphaproteobacteria bacterium RIFCSPHIGHO2_12_FULL_63_12]
MTSHVSLSAGDPAPWFKQRTDANPRFSFDTVAGRYIVLCFFASASDPHSRAAIEAALARRDIFNDDKASFFGVSLDPSDEAAKRIADRPPGVRFFHDFDASVSALYGAAPIDAADRTGPVTAMRRWVIIDPTLRIIDVVPFAPDRSDINAALSLVEKSPPPASFPGFEVSAPILVLPNVFDRDFCRALVGLYETHGGEDSGFVREIDGKTVGVSDYAHKRRRDYTIDDKAIIDRTKALVQRRIAPEILKVHQFRATRMERFIVSCYDAAEEAHFRAHRDNTTSGTAHRRFAVSINLNDDFDGGEVMFPEYGMRSYKAPVGGAVVFSCSMLHAVTKVTRGRRYAFLPFVYDEAAAKLREENNAKLGDGVPVYQAGR